MKNEETSKRLMLALSNAHMKQQELADKSGVSKAPISQYMSGSNAPSNISSGKMAPILDVNPLWLMGFDVPMNIEKNTCEITNVFPIELKRFPLLGEIACGEPKFTNENRESYVLSGTDINADFCLKAKGDSMVNARIHDGDIVFIQKQDMVENGDIAAVVVNGDSGSNTKRFYYYREKSMLILKPENPSFEDQIYTGEELNQVHVLGRAIAFQSDVK